MDTLNKQLKQLKEDLDEAVAAREQGELRLQFAQQQLQTAKFNELDLTN